MDDKIKHATTPNKLLNTVSGAPVPSASGTVSFPPPPPTGRRRRMGPEVKGLCAHEFIFIHCEKGKALVATTCGY